MPFIKGITDVCTARSASGATDQAEISLVNAEAMERYRRDFTSAKPLNGSLDREY